jgi:hypothetical protein
LYLAVERWLTETFGGARIAQTTLFRFAMAIVTYIAVNVTWVFFRAQDFPQAFAMLVSMVGLQASTSPALASIRIISTVCIIAALVGIHWFMRDRSLESVAERAPNWLTGVLWGAMLFAIVTTQGTGDAFIYFQF